jgi:HEAT repeat protein
LPSKKLEDRIERLRDLRANASAVDAESFLRKALTDRSNLVIAEAAKIAGELHFSQLIPQLLSAFDRCLEEPLKTDPKCWGKTAIVKSLAQLDYSDSPVFVRGARHIQMEPVWGGHEDSAIHLRANSILALVQCTDLTRFEVLCHLVEAITDRADPVRIEAVRALNQLGGDDCQLLLRLKARVGDRRPLIVGHVFDALLNMERDRAVPFVSEYMSSGDQEVRDEAALALGGSRLSTALKALIDTWQNNQTGEFADVLLRAISASRLPEAIEFLLGVLTTGADREAAAALEALKIHQGSLDIQVLIEQAKKSRVQKRV